MARKPKEPVVNVELSPAFVQQVVIPLLGKVASGGELDDTEREGIRLLHESVKIGFVNFMRGR